MRGAAAAADWTGQDRGGVATSTEEPARPRAPQSRGPGPVTDGPRKGEQRRRRRRGGSGDTMSSPSPGKRRMDTDVVKLYPSWRGDSGCNGGGGVGMPRAPPETQSGAPRALQATVRGFLPSFPPPSAYGGSLAAPRNREPFQLPLYLQHPEMWVFSSLFLHPQCP